MKITLARLWPAILCALTLPLSGLLIRPYVEIGWVDDGSYIRSAQALARTGHIVYNGGATAMLGWQLYLGAAFMKLFGFSFTAARSAVLLVAMATAFLLQRTFVRAGIGDWNATIGTLTFVLSPLFLPLAFTFMTDVPGVFGIVLCLYACLRALQARTPGRTFAWICFATASSAIGGTVRQTAWLGALVMVPSTLWLLRRRPRLLQAGLLVWVAGVVAIFALLHWYYLQPYAIRENVAALGDAKLRGWVYNVSLSTLTLLALLLPILMMFIPAPSWKNRRVVLFASGSALACLLAGFAMAIHGTLSAWLVPLEEWTIHGAAISMPIQGMRPLLRPIGPRILFTGATIAGAICLVAFALFRPKAAPTPPSPQGEILSWHRLGILLAPFTLGYLVLLLPRALYVVVFDRYLLALIMVAVLVLLRFYQDQVRVRLPGASVLLLAVFAGYAISATHDTFSMFRARLAALNELYSGGVAATAIDAGFDTNILTEIDQTGFENDSRIVIPAEAYVPVPPPSPLEVCRPHMAELLPSIHPRYALSFDPAACAGQSRFAPVTFHEWLRPHSVTIYIVNVAGSKQ